MKRHYFTLHELGCAVFAITGCALSLLGIVTLAGYLATKFFLGA